MFISPPWLRLRQLLSLGYYLIVGSEASDPTWKNIGIPLDLIRFLTKIRMQILGQKLERFWWIFWWKKLENAFFAVKRSIFFRFKNFKNWHLQIYQTKLTIWLKLLCDLKGPHNGNLKMNHMQNYQTKLTICVKLMWNL